MELYHNQVTRVKDRFPLRRFHRSWGILMIQANITSANHGARFSHMRGISPAAVAPTDYDIVGTRPSL